MSSRRFSVASARSPYPFCRSISAIFLYAAFAEDSCVIAKLKREIAGRYFERRIVYFRTYANNGYSGDLEIALIPEWFRTEILKELLDSNGVLVEKADNTESVKFALLFEFDGDEHGIRHVLYNCAASRPSIESQTKEETIEPRTETLNLTADPREDGLVKSRTGDTTAKATYDGWYGAVYVPTIENESEGTEE